jgi:NAD(P)-dependent dehydrogenase (short-subunit alcohol dehydrogenase family)
VRETLRRGDRVIASLRAFPEGFSAASHFAADGLTIVEGDIHCFKLDLDWDTAQITEAVSSAIQQFGGRLDYLVNNAGYVYKGISEEGGYGPSFYV